METEGGGSPRSVYNERVSWLARARELGGVSSVVPAPECFCGAGHVGESTEVEYGDEVKHEVSTCRRVRH